MTAGRLPVLLCCAAEDRFALAPAVERLVRESIVVDFVSGVDFDPTRLEEAIGRHRKQALYVLVRSERLDRFKLTRLQLLFKREGLLESNVVPVQLLAERPESVANPVLEWIRQDLDPARSHASPAASPPAPPASSPRKPTVPAEAPPVRRTDLLSAPQPPPALPPVRASSPPPVRAPIAPAAAPPPTPTAAPPPPPTAALPPAPVARPLAPPPPPLADEDLDLAEAGFGPRKRLPWIAAGIGAVALVGVALVLALGGTDEDEPEPPAAVETPPAKPEPPPESAPEPAPAPEPTPEPVPEPAPEPEPEPEPKPEPEPEPDTRQPPTPTPTPSSLTPAEEHTAMMEALRSRRVRAVDLVVFVPAASRYGNLARAEKYCAQMAVEELRGWRLASAPELRILLEAGMARPARYWTNQPARANKQFMLEGRTLRASARSKSFKGGRALCVRDQAPTGEPETP